MPPALLQSLAPLHDASVRDAGPLPAGHPAAWGPLLEGTALAGEAFPGCGPMHGSMSGPRRGRARR